MEDWKIKKAYKIVYEDLKKTCQTYNQCINCPIKETCDKTDDGLLCLVGEIKEKLFGSGELIVKNIFELLLEILQTVEKNSDEVIIFEYDFINECEYGYINFAFKEENYSMIFDNGILKEIRKEEK